MFFNATSKEKNITVLITVLMETLSCHPNWLKLQLFWWTNCPNCLTNLPALYTLSRPRWKTIETQNRNCINIKQFNDQWRHSFATRRKKCIHFHLCTKLRCIFFANSARPLFRQPHKYKWQRVSPCFNFLSNTNQITTELRLISVPKLTLSV